MTLTSLPAPESGLLNCLVKGEGRFADPLWGQVVGNGG